jgi:hypothetical protein
LKKKLGRSESGWLDDQKDVVASREAGAGQQEISFIQAQDAARFGAVVAD